jgi:hypothetical protein
LSSNSKYSHGNDTIDRYPLPCGDLQKILCVSEPTFKTILKDFEAFKIYCGPKPRLANKEQIVKSQAPQAPRSEKPKSSHYEPTNTIHLQYTSIRRWRRVDEWFKQYAHEADNQMFQKMILIE